MTAFSERDKLKGPTNSKQEARDYFTVPYGLLQNAAEIPIFPVFYLAGTVTSQAQVLGTQSGAKAVAVISPRAATFKKKAAQRIMELRNDLASL